VSHEIVNLPHSRHWRDIHQPVPSKNMPRAGLWRRTKDWLRIAGIALAALVVGWGAWEVVAALQENPKNMPAAAKAVPVKQFSLKTDGKLDAAWLVRTLALPKGASLMELDLQELRARLLADGQVSAATLTRNFPDTLEARLAERDPVVRLRAELRPGDVRTLLVAKDGVVFEGAGFDAERLAALPWLSPAKLTRQGGRIMPIAGMDLVAALLDLAQRETERLYRTWQVVSLTSLESDGEIEVRTKQGAVVVFGAKADFFPQLAKLDSLWELLANSPVPPAKINLALGREVPVSFAPQAAAAPAKATAGFQFFQPKPKT